MNERHDRKVGRAREVQKGRWRWSEGDIGVSFATCAELVARSLVARFDQGCRAIKMRTCQIAWVWFITVRKCRKGEMKRRGRGIRDSSTCNEVNGYVPQVNVVDKVSKARKN